MQPVELPFLIVHGAWVSKAVVAVGAIALLLLIDGARVWLARWSAKVDAREIGSSAAVRPSEYVRQLRGVLRGGHAATFTRRILGVASVKHDRASELWLDCQGERVALRDGIHVVHGAQTAQSRRAIRELGPSALVECSRLWRTQRLARVADGDEVVVHATTEARRGEDGQWVFDGPLQVYAIRQDVKARRLGLVALAVVIATAIASSYHLAKYVGKRALKVADRAPVWIVDLDQLAPYALAAAMPGTRGEALASLEHVLANLNDGNELALRVRRSLVRFERGCVGEVEVLIRHQLFAEAASLADRCGLAELAASSLVWLGRFDEARAQVADDHWTYRAGVTAIARGRWDEAAEAATQLQSHPDNAAPHDSHCIAELFRAWSNDEAAASRLAKLAAEHRTKTCAFALAEVTADEHRWEAFQAAWPEDKTPVERAYLLRALLDGEDVDTLEYARASDHLERSAWPWFAPFAVAKWQGRQAEAERYGWSVSLGLRALLHLQRGNLEAAARDATQGSALDSTAYAWRRHAVESWIALRTDQQPITSSAMDTKELVRIRNGAAIPELHFFGKRCKEDGPPAIAAASAGDGRALATLLTRCTLSWTDYDRIVALLPRIQQGRDELGKYFALFRESHATYAYRPFHWVEYAARQRDLARLLGNASEAARWQRIVDNYLDVFSDRRRVVALYLWTSDEV